MTVDGVTVYPWRWVVLGVFMLVNVMVQVLWICFAPIASLAAAAYGVGRESIDLLSYLFMFIYIAVAIPSAWAIDRFGFKKAVGFGSVLVAVFALLRGLFPGNYAMLLVGTVGISIGQPFLMNAFLKFAANWFPHKQRATITGLLFLAMFLGVGIGEAATPGLLEAGGFGGMQLIYGGVTAAAALLFLVFARSEPPTPASPPDEAVRALVLDGLKRIVRTRDVWFVCFGLLVGGGFVNVILTLIDGIGAEKGLSTDQGVLLTIAILAGGILGSLVIPMLSDFLRRRKAILVAGILAVVPISLGLVLGSGFELLLAMSLLVGFLITGITPLAYQYGAEITHPAPEGTSNGVFALFVQASGFIILLVDALTPGFGSYRPSLLGIVGLLVVCGVLFALMKESPEMHRRRAARGVPPNPR